MFIDTLHVFIDDFTSNGDVSGFKAIKKHSIQKSESGKIGEQTYATYENEKIDLHVSMHVDNRLKIHVSVNKLVNHNEIESGKKQYDYSKILRSFFRKAQSKFGLSFDIDKAKLNRVDIFSDKKVDSPVPFYIAEISSISDFGSMKQKVDPKQYGNSYIRWQDFCRQLVVSDKVQEMKHRNLPGPSGNWLRVEYRLMNTNGCKIDDLNVVEDLYDPEVLKMIWYGHLTELFEAAKDRGADSRSMVIYSDVFQTVKDFINSNEMNPRKVISSIAGIYLKTVVDEYGGMKKFLRLVDELNEDKIKQARIQQIVALFHKLYDGWRIPETDKNKTIQIWEELFEWAESVAVS